MSQSSSRNPGPFVFSSLTLAVCEEGPLSRERQAGNRWCKDKDAEGSLGMGEARVTTLSEAELFLLPSQGGEGYRGASRSSRSGWEAEQIDDLFTEGLEVVQHSVGLSSAVTRVRLRGQG